MKGNSRKIGYFLFLFFLMFLLPSARADQLGTATGVQVNCPPQPRGVTADACYAVTVSNCLFASPGHPKGKNDPQFLAPFIGYLKLNNAPDALGMEVEGTGGNGTVPYDYLLYGASEVTQLLNQNISVVDLTWGYPFTNDQPEGWQTGPANGIRATMCRYATVLQWVHDNLANGLPMGATGISAGSEQIAGALQFYHARAILPAGAVFGSGPPFAREDWSCDGVQPKTTNPCSGQPVTENVGITNAVQFIDPSLEGPACSWELDHKSKKYDSYLLPDSVNATNGDTDNTWASHIPSSWVLGYDPTHPNNSDYSDTSSATGMAAIHWNSHPGHGGFMCTPAPHNLMQTQAGADTVAAQVISQFQQLKK